MWLWTELTSGHVTVVGTFIARTLYLTRKS